jgi:hypothetical protein
MSEPAAGLYRLVTDPNVFCDLCGHPVHCRRVDGRNLPCLCFAATRTGCRACETDTADRLQAALEPSDAEAMAQRRADAILKQAEHWRPNLRCWAAFTVVAALLLIGSYLTLSIGP